MTAPAEPTTGPETDPADLPEETAEEQDGEEHQDDGSEPMTLENARKLRRENATLRERAKDAEARAETARTLSDEQAKRLHIALVAQTGKLADPTDLPFDAEHLTDDGKLNAAIDALTDSKPHLKARKVSGDIGQGRKSQQDNGVDLAGMLRARA